MTHHDDPHRPATAPVLVGVDGSPGAETALRWAAQFAVRRGRPLQIAHGMNLARIGARFGAYAVTAAPAVEAARTRGYDIVERAEQLVREIAPELPVTTALTNDRGAALLIDHSAEAYAVVLGATGSSGTLTHLGSTLLTVTAHAAGTVIVVRTDPDAGDAVHTGGPVVVGVDGTPTSEAAIATAFSEAAARRTDLIAVHTWSDWNFGRHGARDDLLPPGADFEQTEEAILAERLAGWQEKYPDVSVTRYIYLSDPAAQLQQWSHTAQLVVVGSRGHGGLTGLLLGSTANYLVQHAHCPVVVVHPAERPPQPDSNA
ncbi:universal stress protein [Nocardia mexicana]|uniref:Nucleotide-binding universal stress UspA family protein n=1 Tax=Nocardia mexicana TaxID=279262 RepID=A0A370HDF5_9NOCA|nr:universal stress protein [Nocardia mexicana]RDI55273.1 nucleotide-binding universal stress UspA family protein [Nocardia mexicana]